MLLFLNASGFGKRMSKMKIAEYEQIVLIAEEKNKDAFRKVLKSLARKTHHDQSSWG